MKAAFCPRYGPPEVFQVRVVDTPVPGSRDVLIRVGAAAVTVSDTYIRSGVPTAPLWYRTLMRLGIGFGGPRQSILGSFLAGEVAAVGKGVTRFRVGDRVYGCTLMRMGCYAEYVRVPGKSLLVPAPANLTDEEAAAIPYGALIALHFLRKSGLQEGQEILIYGASGAIGTAAVQLAKHFGARVTAACSSTNAELVRSIGADATVDYTKVQAPPPNARYDLMFDAVGRRLTSALKVACREALPRDRYFSVDRGLPWPNLESLLFLTPLVESGVLRPVIDKRYRLEDIAEAHRYVEQRHKRGNVVVTLAG